MKRPDGSRAMRFMLSLTSIPRRFDTALRATIDSLLRQHDCPDILLNIPHHYRKWGRCHVPTAFRNMDKLTIHELDVDYGPATKLLGALAYLRDNPVATHVVTVDDDFCFTNRNYIRFLMRCSAVAPEAAMTIGGVALRNPPYRCGSGLGYRNRYKFVDVPAGYQGVVYPVAPLLSSPLTFSLRDALPDGVFHDDDAYFGILLSRLAIPLFALPPPLLNRLQASGGAGESGVGEAVAVDRMTNESEIFVDATERGLLVPASRRSAPPFGPRRALRLRYEHLKSAWPF